jgi:hypothetical protein
VFIRGGLYPDLHEPVHTLPFYVIKMHFNIILPYIPSGPTLCAIICALCIYLL